MTATTNIILPTIRFLPVTRDIIRHVVGAIESDTDVHLTVANGQEDDYKKEWILRETGNLAANDRLTYIGLKDARQRLLRAVQLESKWILFLSDDDPYSVDFIRTMCSESRTASSDTMAVVPSTYLSYSSAQMHLFRLQNIVEQTQKARLLSLYQQAHLNGILTCAMMRRKPVLEWLDFLSGKAIWPTYADQLLVSHLAMKGDIVASKEESFYAKDQRDWHDPKRAIIKDSGSYDEKHLTLFHEIFWISDLFTLLRSNGLQDGALPSLTFRAVALLNGGSSVFENRLRVLDIETSNYSEKAYSLVTRLAAQAAALAEKPPDDHLRFFTQLQSVAAGLQTKGEIHRGLSSHLFQQGGEPTVPQTESTFPVVSVVIPCYNQAHWITEALDSVIAQSYQQWECIVVNDGSSDNTSEVVTNFIRDHAGFAIRLLEVKNGGLSSARNRGIEAAQSKYILPLDSDDRIHPDYLQRCVDVLKERSDISIVYCDRQDFGISEQQVHAVDFDFNRLINGNILSYCSMYRKKVWKDAGGYDESLNSYEDWNFWISAVKRGHKGFHIKECLFYYRVKEQSMYTDALKRDGQLKAQIILNHPELYSPQTVRDAQQVLSVVTQVNQIASATPQALLASCAGSEEALGLMRLADEQFGRGDLKAARESLGQALAILPDDPQLLLAYGNIILRLGDLEGARREFVKAATLYPTHGPSHLNLAAVLVMLERREEAERSVKRALELNPNDPDALKLFGRLCVESRRYDEGAKAYSAALGDNPSDIEALLMLGRCACERNDLNTVRLMCERVLQIEPGHAVAEERLVAVKGQVTVAGLLLTKVPETSRPMVSVIVPTFNRPDTLINALRSILDQTYQDFEIIVVNDAGVDAESIVRFLDKDGRIAYIRHGSNRNLAAARNTGIRVASGKYIAYLDDDDMYYPDHLETLITYLQQSGQKVAYTDAHRAHQEKRDGRYVVTKRDIPYSFDFDYDRILVHNFVPVLCFMHERACLDTVGPFDESLTTHEDWEMWIRMSRRFQFAHIKKVTCEFTSRIDGSTMSSSKRPDFRRTYAVILERYKVMAPEKPHVRAAQERVLQQLRGTTAGADAGASVQPAESQRIAALLQRVDEHCKTENFQGAKEVLEQALEILPDDPHLTLTLGNIVLRLGDVEGARREFLKATGLHPDYAPAHADLAVVLLHLGRGVEAEASARLALELESTNVSALKILAKICLDTERYQEAVQTYATILALAPDDIETLLLVGNCYAETGRLEEAKTFYRRVLQLDPGNTIAMENLAVVGGNTPVEQTDLIGREAAKPGSVQVSIIIPVFNRLDLTRQCLKSVHRNTPAERYEVIVVDNGSSDGTAEFLRREQDAGRLRAVLSPENGGFARACNQGARAAAGTYLLFLNNDTEVQPGWFEPLVAVLDADLRIGAVGSKLLFPNGAIQHAGVIIVDDQRSGKGLVPTHIHYREIVDPSQVNQSMTFQALTAACLLIRRSVFEQVHGFEEDYRNGYEDVDLCFKMQECGWLMVYEPKSVVIHYESQSGAERFSHERDNFDRLVQKWTWRIVPDVVIRADGKLVNSNPNRARPYHSPAHFPNSILTGSQVSLARNGGLADRPAICGEKASPESVAPDKITEALRCAEAYIKRENLEAAGQVLTEAIAKTPDNPDLIVACGHVAWKHGDLEKAHLQFIQAVTLDPNHAPAHAALAVLFLQQSRLAEAEEAARKALAIDAAEVTALKVLAKVCLDTDRYQEAVQTYATILEHAPDDIETLILVGNCYVETGRFEQARSFYRKVLALDSSNAVAAGNLAEVDRRVAASDGTATEPLAPAASEGFPSVSIVVVTYNSASTIRACLDSVLCESRPAREVIVVDNVSTDGTRSILSEYQGRIVTILNQENIGFSAACNQGIRASGGEYVVLLNPDTVVTPGWLDRLIGYCGPDVGAVGPVSDYAAELQNIDRSLPNGAPRRMGLREVTDLLSQANNGKARETKLLTGFCLMVPRKVLDEVGLLDESLFLGNDDLDLSWRLRLKGYRLLVATDAFVHHEGQVSFKSEAKTKTSRLVQDSTDRLYAKIEAHYGPGNVPSPMELWGINWFKPTTATSKTAQPSSAPTIPLPRKPLPPVPSPSEGRGLGRGCEPSAHEVLPEPRLSAPSLTSIIILTLNRLEDTRKCLASIEAHTPELHELIIVDNASTDGTLDYLRDYMATYDNVRVVANRTNRGFAAGNNQGLALARGDYLLLLNNDTIVTEGWLRRMLAVVEAHPGVGIVGPMSNYVSGPQLVRDASYDGPEWLDAFAVEWAQDHDGQSAEATRVVGFCLLTRKEVITRIGGLDEQFGSGNFEDDDFCVRAFQVGFRARIAMDVFIHHTGSQTFKAAKIDYRQSLMRNWELFKAKWGIPTDAPYEKGYRFPSQIPQGSDLSIPLPDVGADHRCEDQGRWWQEISERSGRSHPAVTEEMPLSVVIVPNGHGLAPLWPSLVQHTKHPLAITILPSHGNGNGDDPAHEVTCPDGWRISTSDLSAVRLFNQLLQSAHDDPVILLSSDLILTPGWLKRLLAAFDRDRHIAVVGPTLNQGPATQRVKADYKGIGKALRQFGLRRAHRYGGELAEVDSLAPFCIVFKGGACRPIGPLREDLDLAASLHDYFARLRQAGRKVAVILDTYAHYEPHADLSLMGARRADADP